MSDLALFNKIKQGGFLPLQLTLDPLQNILIEIMQLIKNQNSRLDKIENGKTDKEELKCLEGIVDKNNRDTTDKLTDLQSKLDNLEKQINNVTSKCNNALEEAADAKETAKTAENKANEASDSIKLINEKQDKLEDNQRQTNNTVSKHDSEIEELKKHLNDILNQLSDQAKNDTKEITERSIGNNEEIDDLKARVLALEDATKKLTSDVNGLEERKADKSDLKNIESKLRDLEEQLRIIGETNSFDKNSSGPIDTDKVLRNCVNKDELLRLTRQLQDLGSQVELIKSDILPKLDGLGGEVSNEDIDRLNRRISDIERRLNQNTNQEFKPRPPSESSSGRTSVRDSKLDDERIKALEEKLRHHIENCNENNSQNDDINKLREELDRLKAEVDARPDKALIERLFEKFKESMNGVVNMINEKQKPDTNVATLDDIKRLEKLIKSITQEFDEAAAARKCTKCLSCGKGFRTVTGSIQDSETAQILGAAPISHVVTDKKPCFVYGSDHELYYSVSPRGRSFVVTGRKASTADGVRPPANSTK